MTDMTPNITPSPTEQPLYDFMWNFLQVTEAVIPRIYSDSLGVPTLGVGYALITPHKGIWKIDLPKLTSDLGSIGVTLSAGDMTILQNVAQLLNDMQPYRNALANYKKWKNGDPTTLAAYDAYNAYVSDKMDQIQQLIAAPDMAENISTVAVGTDLSLAQKNNPFPDVPLINLDQAKKLLDVILPGYIQMVMTKLHLGTIDSNGNVTFNPNNANAAAFYNSSEMAALVSLVYNGGPSKLTPELIASLNAPDPNDARAEAWYQIRYNSDNAHHVVPDRRAVEARRINGVRLD